MKDLGNTQYFKVETEKDLDVLAKWLKLAARVDSIDVFQERM